MGEAQSAAVIGSGPNGLAAAVTLARAGVPVTLFEAAETIGGGTRTSEAVRPGVLHDVCSAIHPLALATPFFREFELERRMRFAVPDASYANPLDGGAAAVAFRDIDRTAAELGRDGEAYRRFYRPVLDRLEGVVDFALGGSVLRWPRDVPGAVVAALRTIEQGGPLWNLRFHEEAAPALFGGVAAHTVGRMPALAGAAAGLLLGALGHARGWPVPVGGSRRISDVLADDLLRHGGRIETGHAIDDARELGGYGALLFDTSARGLARIAGERLPPRYRRALERFEYGDGATKLDLLLDGPIPWADPRVAETATVHIGGSRSEIAAAEREVSRGAHPERPYVLLAQPTAFDPGRNPAGSHAVWSYTHVPRGSRLDMRERVIRQIERFAPGFRDRIVGVQQTTAAELSVYNRNYVGGDFSSGAVRLGQLLARPVASRDPWRSPTPGIYLASSSASPGPGVHGLSGWYAAISALRNEFGLPAPRLGLDVPPPPRP
ncbi:NAD(P)/FAD-dependent oxidoreductase [Leucobacter sp. CSA1]|uniref:NAD(P)/FAD-dependent oxidoreductase n=1 Tax=Leucobacter chromiisoli TaxID=2796471 RepID=A0A934Q937_9MICO|nr:NAD(P)/FAD-dependent oxidoreductase [Leucobacter chromiisoli]MBK0419758.1 NAD(P)/FAD-dependent oxidoreductase [Leucobacter chromiisoli]